MTYDYGCWCRQLATEMRNLQTNIHDDGDYEIANETAKARILECLYGWELELGKMARIISEQAELQDKSKD